MKAVEIHLSQEELTQLLEYNPVTGIVTWKAGSNRNKRIGMEAGSTCRNGYKRIEVNGKSYMLHRIIWALVYGITVDMQIDHINGDRADNRLENLRAVTPRENQNNRVSHRNGRLCGYKRSRNKWEAQIVYNGKKLFLGRFATEQEAHNAYEEAKLRITNKEAGNGR